MSPKKNTSNQANERLLTEVELELMTIIWSLHKAAIKEVVSHLSQERPLAYTTVATVLKVLEQKGFLACQKDSYAHVFVPLVSKAEYENTCIDHMVAHVFDGEPMALVHRLLSAKKLQHNHIQAIEDALKQLTQDLRQASHSTSRGLSAGSKHLATSMDPADEPRHVELGLLVEEVL